MNIPHFFIKEFLNSNLDTQNRFIFLYSIFFILIKFEKGKNESVPKIPQNLLKVLDNEVQS